MSEEIKKFWNTAKIMAVKFWYDSAKGFNQIDRKKFFPDGMLFKIVNSIHDYKGCIVRLNVFPDYVYYNNLVLVTEMLNEWF